MKRTRTLMILAALGLAGLANPTAATGTTAKCELKRITPQQAVDARGRALLCRSEAGVRGAANVRGLVPDDAFTVWFVYFDDPSLCDVPGKCDGPDFGGENPLGVFGRLDSSIVPASGRVRFHGRIGGFNPSRGSQIWLWIFGHGPANQQDGRQLARQLLTPEDPSAGAPHLGIVGGPLGFPAAVVKFDIP